jgi:MoxR-like ATPase
MIPHDKTRPQIDPRLLVLRGEASEHCRLVCCTGYVPDERIFSDFCESLKSGRPWLISGTRGSGKTAFPEAVATACNLTIFIVAGRDGLTQAEILYDWDREEQAEWMNENMKIAKSLPDVKRDEFMKMARREKWKREFLVLGEMGLAYDLSNEAVSAGADAAPPILVLDESDKFGASLEDAMLMPLERGVIHIPRLDCGFIGVAEWRHRPIVVTTSNDLRHKLSAPFISRHIFSRFATPSLSKEVEILYARCPAADHRQIAIAIKLLDAIRGIAGLEDHPSLRESIDLVNALHRDGVCELDEYLLVKYLCYFAKTSESQDLLKLQLDYLLMMSEAPHPDIDRLPEFGSHLGDHIERSRIEVLVDERLKGIL